MGKKIVHVEFPAQDADRAQKFWEGFGEWTLSVPEGMGEFDYRMFQASDDQGGAIYPAMEGQSPGSVIVYFDTDDIDASIAKVRELGGTAEEKQPVPTHGWFAPCKDTEGNAFSLWQNDSNAA